MNSDEMDRFREETEEKIKRLLKEYAETLFEATKKSDCVTVVESKLVGRFCVENFDGEYNCGVVVDLHEPHIRNFQE